MGSLPPPAGCYTLVWLVTIADSAPLQHSVRSPSLSFSMVGLSDKLHKMISTKGSHENAA